MGSEVKVVLVLQIEHSDINRKLSVERGARWKDVKERIARKVDIDMTRLQCFYDDVCDQTKHSFLVGDEEDWNDATRAWSKDTVFLTLKAHTGKPLIMRQ